MKKKGHKDKIRYKNKVRNRQTATTKPEPEKIEKDSVAEESMKRLELKTLETFGLKEDRIIRDKSFASMSEALLEFAAPLLDVIDYDDKEIYESTIAVSMAIWNSSIMLKNNKSRREVKKLLKPFMQDAESKGIVKHMLHRKQQMFPDNNRLILNFEVTEKADSFHLSVVSTLP